MGTSHWPRLAELDVFVSNATTMARVLIIVTTQVPLDPPTPEPLRSQSPPAQALIRLPEAAVAVRVTADPEGNEALQVSPAIPAVTWQVNAVGLDRTVPVPFD